MKSPPRPARRIAGRPNIKILLTCFVAMMVLVILGPLMTQSDNGALTGEGNSTRQIGYLLIAAVTLVSVRPWRDPGAALRVPLPMVIALAICAVSLSWAIEPAIGFRRLFLTALIIWIISTTVAALGFGQVMNTLRIILAAVLAINIVAAVAFPEIGRHIYNLREDVALLGDWRGIMSHKNFAGAISAVTVLVFLFDADRIPKLVRWGVVVIATGFLLMTQSKTSLGMLIAAIAIGLVFLRYDSRYRPALIALLGVGAIAVTFWLNIYRNWEMYAASDSQAFTGRAFIWQTLSKYLDDNWLTGAGYGSFWNIGPASPIFQYGKDWLLQISSGHNGYLDMAIQVGVPCAAAIVVLMILWPLTRLLLRTDGDGSRPALLLALMIFCAGHNMTESSLLERDLITEVILLITVALIWKTTKREKNGASSSRRQSTSRQGWTGLGAPS